MRARVASRDRLNAMIEEITTSMTSAALVEAMNAAGIPCGPIYSIDQTFADPQVAHLGLAQKVVSGKLGEIALVGQPLTLSRTPSRLAAAAPEMGEHTEEVLAELGIGREEIGRLRTAGAIG